MIHLVIVIVHGSGKIYLHYAISLYSASLNTGYSIQEDIQFHSTARFFILVGQKEKINFL